MYRALKRSEPEARRIMAKQNIFVVEADNDISRLVQHHLEASGYATTIFANGRGVIEEAERVSPSLFLLDVMVPGKDGLELCRTIRQVPWLASTPIVFLTAKNSEADRILGFNLGADDYISKPFSPRELVARVRAVLRRFDAPPALAPVRVGEIEIDPAEMTLKFGENTVPLRRLSFGMVEHFTRQWPRL